MWKVLNDEVLQTLKDHFSIRERNYGHYNAKFHLPLANTNLFKWDIVYQRPKLWNSIPVNIRNKVSVPTFKSALNKHLLSNNWKQYTFWYCTYFILNFWKFDSLLIVYCSRLVRTPLKLWFTNLILLKFWYFLSCYKEKLNQ